jgi:hypothetical protein
MGEYDYIHGDGQAPQKIIGEGFSLVTGQLRVRYHYEQIVIAARCGIAAGVRSKQVDAFCS